MTAEKRLDVGSQKLNWGNLQMGKGRQCGNIKQYILIFFQGIQLAVSALKLERLFTAHEDKAPMSIDTAKIEKIPVLVLWCYEFPSLLSTFYHVYYVTM